MIKSYLLMFAADLCYFLANDCDAFAKWLRSKEQSILSKSYMAQGSGKGPWSNG
jgi:hypothetical protein